tara:strand:+ start:800 stop:1024 length:225 start_codon:yes stop_codon:yes gene_type:complete
MQSLTYSFSLHDVPLLEQLVDFFVLADFLLAVLADPVFVVLLVLIFVVFRIKTSLCIQDFFRNRLPKHLNFGNL